MHISIKQAREFSEDVKSEVLVFRKILKVHFTYNKINNYVFVYSANYNIIRSRGITDGVTFGELDTSVYSYSYDDIVIPFRRALGLL